MSIFYRVRQHENHQPMEERLAARQRWAQEFAKPNRVRQGKEPRSCVHPC